MYKNKLKTALQQAVMMEMESLPDESILAGKYSFSTNFQRRIDRLIKETDDKYITVFDRSIDKKRIVYAILATGLLFTAVFYRNGALNYRQIRYVIIIMEMILLGMFGTTVKKISTDITRSYKTAFVDGEENEDEELDLPVMWPVTRPVHTMKYLLPQVPAGYVKKQEYRDVTSHTAEFSDGLGRKISYSRYELYNGVLKRIKSKDAPLTKLTVNGCNAVSFVLEGQANLVWVDKHYLYHLCGDCKTELLTEMAESMKKTKK